MAGHDIAIETARNTVTESHSSHTKKFGLFGTGGVGFTIGTQTRENTADIDEQFHTGSLIGSTEGRVDIVAGGDVAIAGSDVLSKAGIGITGENVAITAVENSLSVVEAQKFRQAGLNVSLKGGVVDTAMAVYGAAKRSEEVEDDRLKALYAAQAGQTLFSGGQAGLNSFATTGQQFGELANTNTDTKASGNSGLSLRIGIGASKSDSKQTYTEATAEGSRIASEGDVAIIARSGDVTVTGSRIEGDNVALAAARDLILQSAEESSELRARNQSSSGEIGITIGTEAGIGVYVSASMAKGEGNGNGTTHAETTVEAADTLTLISGRDTTLEGAQAIGETVIANVGRHLTLTSQQDSNDYDREDMSAGIDVAVGMGGATVSGYYNQSDIESTYTSVNEQTGIQAGAGGFDIEVGGHTELTGAAIASTADPGLNRLSTESLSVSDLYNEAAYEATSFGVSASGGSGGGSFSPNIAPPQSEESDSTTRAGISAGVVDIRNGDRSALDDVDRSVTELQQSGLGEIFDEQEVAERTEMAQVAGQVGMRAAGDLADQMGWEEGSREKVILHGVVGAGIAALGGGDALQGLTGAAASQLVTVKMQDYLKSQDIDPNSPEGRSLMELGSLAVGAAVGGVAGASTALSGEQFNRQLHPTEKQVIRDELAEQYASAHGMTVEQAQQVLEDQLLRMVDATEAEKGGWNQAAANYLKGYAYSVGQYSIGQDQWGNNVPLFGTSAGYQRQDSTIFSASPQTTRPPPKLGLGAAGDYFSNLAEGSIGVVGDAFDAIAHPLNTAANIWDFAAALVSDPIGTGVAMQEGVRPIANAGELGDMGPAGEWMGEQLGGTALGLGAGIAGQWIGGKWMPGKNVVEAGVSWGKGIQAQGMPWENFLAAQLPASSRLPPGFKTFDFFDRQSGLAISAKTLDTTTPGKLTNPGQVYSSLRNNIDAVTNYSQSRTLKGVTLRPSDIVARELHVAVPEQTTPGQWQQIQRAIEYGRQKGVTVRVTQVRGGGGE